MRELKFRAWDTKQKRMYKNPFNGKIGGINDIFANTGDWIFMQCVGSEDLGDMEMFEGDIVEISTDYKINVATGEKKPCKAFEVGEIIYNSDKAGFEVLVRKQLESRYDGEIPYPRSLQCHHWKIIGNIYENHELMEEAKP